MKIENSIYFAMTALKKIACLSQSKFLFRSFEVRFGLSGFSTSPNVFESSNIIESTNVVKSSCVSVDIQQLPLSNFIWDKSVKNHGDKIALVCSPDNVIVFFSTPFWSFQIYSPMNCSNNFEQFFWQSYFDEWLLLCIGVLLKLLSFRILLIINLFFLQIVLPTILNSYDSNRRILNFSV